MTPDHLPAASPHGSEAAGRALVLGGTGLVGAAVARRLRCSGWAVDVTGRAPDNVPEDFPGAGITFRSAQREDPRALSAALGGGFDVVVDCLCFTRTHAELLLPLLGDVGSLVMISSKAVYVDPLGNHVNSPTAPRFEAPVAEDTPTVTAGDGDYRSPDGYGSNKVAAEQTLLSSGHPVTVVRASKVHGTDTPAPREWAFVRRALDGRRLLPLAHRGSGLDHTTAAVNLAALVETVAARPGTRVLNSADPDSPDVLTIARTIGSVLGHEWQEVLLDDDAPADLGRSPWNARSRLVLDTTASLALGYRPVGTYAETVRATVEHLVRTAGDPRWAAERADLAAAYGESYDAEDARLLAYLRGMA